MHSPRQTAFGWKVPPAVTHAPPSMEPIAQATGWPTSGKSWQHAAVVVPSISHAPAPVQRLPTGPTVPPSAVHISGDEVQRQLVPPPSQQTPAGGSSTA